MGFHSTAGLWEFFASSPVPPALLNIYLPDDPAAFSSQIKIAITLEAFISAALYGPARNTIRSLRVHTARKKGNNEEKKMIIAREGNEKKAPARSVGKNSITSQWVVA